MVSNQWMHDAGRQASGRNGPCKEAKDVPVCTHATHFRCPWGRIQAWGMARHRTSLLLLTKHGVPRSRMGCRSQMLLRTNTTPQNDSIGTEQTWGGSEAPTSVPPHRTGTRGSGSGVLLDRFGNGGLAGRPLCESRGSRLGPPSPPPIVSLSFHSVVDCSARGSRIPTRLPRHPRHRNARLQPCFSCVASCQIEAVPSRRGTADPFTAHLTLRMLSLLYRLRKHHAVDLFRSTRSDEQLPRLGGRCQMMLPALVPV